MVEATDHNGKGQRNVPVTAFQHMPPTVTDHEEHPDGMTLVTLDPDPDTNIEIYDDKREPHRSGNLPTDS